MASCRKDYRDRDSTTADIKQQAFYRQESHNEKTAERDELTFSSCIQGTRAVCPGFILLTGLVLVQIIGETQQKHEDTITHCSARDKNKIEMPYMVSDKIEGLIRVNNLTCVITNARIH